MGDRRRAVPAVDRLEEENDRLRRQLAQALRRDNFGPYQLGWWAEHVVHADPCDCDLDEEVLGDVCGRTSGARPALLQDQGGFAPTLLLILPPLLAPEQTGPYIAVHASDMPPPTTQPPEE